MGNEARQSTGAIVEELRERDPFCDLARLIEVRAARIGVIGMGYVGLPLAQVFWQAGFPVVGIDPDASKVDLINDGRSHVERVSPFDVRHMLESGRFEATTGIECVGDLDALLICVPTPVTRQREPDLSYVVNAANSVARHLRPGQMVVLESTTYPGTTSNVVQPILERTGLVSGEDFFLGFSPEREDPGNREFTTSQIPKVVAGEGEKASTLVAALYAAGLERIVPVSSTRAAEAVKLTENIFRATNIGLVNELKRIYSAMEIDVWEVIEAASTKPFGFMPFYPGPGLGGHCIPIDPFYLTWSAREVGEPTRFIELAGEINGAMPRYVVSRCREALSDLSRKALNGASVLLLGMAYKRDIADIRESPSLEIAELLLGAGASVDFHDPHVSLIGGHGSPDCLHGLSSVPLDETVLSNTDLVVICTDHTSIDYELVGRAAKLVVDTRNVMARSGADVSRTVKA